jgi:hypothetical protein
MGEVRLDEGNFGDFQTLLLISAARQAIRCSERGPVLENAIG